MVYMILHGRHGSEQLDPGGLSHLQPTTMRFIEAAETLAAFDISRHEGACILAATLAAAATVSVVPVALADLC